MTRPLWRLLAFPFRLFFILVGLLAAAVVLAFAIAWEDRGTDIEGGQ